METVKNIYARMNKGVFYSCLGISIFLIVTAFFVPPTAVIDGTVIAAVGELFAYPALATVILAIERGSDIKLQKGETTIHIDNPDNNEEKHHKHND